MIRGKKFAGYYNYNIKIIYNIIIYNIIIWKAFCGTDVLYVIHKYVYKKNKKIKKIKIILEIFKISYYGHCFGKTIDLKSNANRFFLPFR